MYGSMRAADYEIPSYRDHEVREIRGAIIPCAGRIGVQP
jgi:hypothetical protein